jgi:hypothetical protein
LSTVLSLTLFTIITQFSFPLLFYSIQNWEFQYYLNNRTRSYTKDGILYIKPGLLSDIRGEEFLMSGTMDVNGGAPAD